MNEAGKTEKRLFSEYRKTWEYLDRVTWQLPLAAIALALFVGFGLEGLANLNYGVAGFIGMFLWLRSFFVGVLALGAAMMQFRYLKRQSELQEKLVQLEEEQLSLLMSPSFFSLDGSQPEGFLARLSHPKWLWAYGLLLVGIVSFIATLVLFMQWLMWMM